MENGECLVELRKKLAGVTRRISAARYRHNSLLYGRIISSDREERLASCDREERLLHELASERDILKSKISREDGGGVNPLLPEYSELYEN